MSAYLPNSVQVPAGIVLLDGNGDPLDTSRLYFNRWRGPISHDISINDVIMQWGTIFGVPYCQPVARVTTRYGFQYSKRVFHCRFASDRIRDGVYGFCQLIPLGAKIAFDIPRADLSRTYRKMVLEKLGGQEA